MDKCKDTSSSRRSWKQACTAAVRARGWGCTRRGLALWKVRSMSFRSGPWKAGTTGGGPASPVRPAPPGACGTCAGRRCPSPPRAGGRRLRILSVAQDVLRAHKAGPDPLRVLRTEGGFMGSPFAVRASALSPRTGGSSGAGRPRSRRSGAPAGAPSARRPRAGQAGARAGRTDEIRQDRLYLHTRPYGTLSHRQLVWPLRY